MDSTFDELVARFGIDGTDNIVHDQHFGIVNGHLTTNVPHSNVLNFRLLYAPPYASSNFSFDAYVCGELVWTDSYSWMPHQIKRQGRVPGVEVASTITLIEGERALALEVKLRNTGPETREIPVQFDIKGGLDYPTDWNFAQPEGIKPVYESIKDDLVTLKNDTGAIVFGARDISRYGYVPLWETSLTLAAGETDSFWFVLAVGNLKAARRVAGELLQDPAGAVRKSNEQWVGRANELMGRLPKFSASDKRLERFYDRSALHFLLNRWEVEEFLLHPYYSTGSVNGGCIVSYLWDFGEAWELFSIFDPAAAREHIKTFLGINLTQHFAFNPISGAGWGPWYYVNQEKIIFHVYHYLLQTGDVDFLNETVRGRTVLELVEEQALFGDELEDEANLIDYGRGNHHLELRRSYRYDHYLPDLNMRRYANYLAADVIFQVAGRKPSVDFRERAEKLKKLVRDTMWSEKDKWWFHIDSSGNKDLRYTIQLFKLVDSPVLSEHEREMLIGHLNEEEFLGTYGMHSMSKLDVAYDQVDIDNGGGGAYTGFPPQVIEKLYKAGYPQLAEDILRRILWWGERLPCWGDSLVANFVDYRRDTPLQNTIGSVSGAQAYIYGMFGVGAHANGSITVNPVPPSYSPEIALEGLKILGKTIDITVREGSYEVSVDGNSTLVEIGTPFLIPNDES